MVEYWLDPVFLEMFFDRFLRGTALVWYAVWQPAVWLLAGLLISLLCARRPAHAHRFLLLACLAAVLTPLLSMVVERMNWGLLRRPAPEPSYVLLAPDDRQGAAPPAAAFVPAKVVRPFSLSAAFLWAWLAFSAFCAARLLLSLGLGRRLLARAKPLHDPRVQAALDTAAAKLGLSAVPALYTSEQVRSPVIYCWGKRPILLLPAQAAQLLSETAWVAIFCHELAHCQRRDHRASLLAELSVILMPWNPLAWRMKRRLGYLAERTCDDWVLHAGQPAADYAETLLQLVPQRGPALALAAVSGRQTLKARIRKILRSSHRKPTVSRWWSASISAVTAATVVLLALAQASTENRMPTREEPITLSGHVLGADGQPLAGAPVVVMTCPWLVTEPEKLALYTGYEVLAQGTTTPDGRFQVQFDAHARNRPGQENVVVGSRNPLPLHVMAAAAGHGSKWLPIPYPLHDQAGLELRLPPEELIHGRLIDLQGQPAANVRLEVIRIGSPGRPVGDYYGPNQTTRLAVLLPEWKNPDPSNGFSQTDSGRTKGVQFWSPPHGLPTWPAPGMTDPQGRFVLQGIAAEQEIGLVVRDERYAYQMLRIGPRKELRSPVTLALPPARFIEGTVTDEQTGNAVPDARIYAEANAVALLGGNSGQADWKGQSRLNSRDEIGRMAPTNGFRERIKLPNAEVRTDSHGHFRIQVYPEFESNENPIFAPNRFVIWIYGPDDQPYLDVGRELFWPSGAVKQKVDVALPRGVLVRGVVKEDRTGQAIAGARVDCWSKGLKSPPGVLPPGPVQTGRDGMFQVVLPPTHWHLLVNGPGIPEAYQHYEDIRTGFVEEPIEIARLTDNLSLLNARKSNYVLYKEIGRPPSYYPDAWLALDVKPDFPPQSVSVVLQRKQPVFLTSAKSLP